MTSKGDDQYNGGRKIGTMGTAARVGVGLICVVSVMSNYLYSCAALLRRLHGAFGAARLCRV